MSEKFCIHCGKQFSFKEKFCLHCGKKKEKSKKNFKIFLFFIAGILILFSFLYYLGSSEDFQEVNSLEEIMKLFKEEESVIEEYDVASTVVNIFCPYEGEKISLDSYGSGGSGTIISKSGQVLTNSHIISQDETSLDVNEEGCIVVFPDQSTGLPKEAYLAIPYVIESLSDEYDLALLEIYDAYIGRDGESYGIFPKEFTEISDEFCDEEELKLGEPIKVYGYPLITGGYSLTVTEGVFSAFNEMGIYTSAKIDSGNSGGLAIDERGCFIGVPTAVSGGEHESYGLITPAYQVREFLEKFNSLYEESE